MTVTTEEIAAALDAADVSNLAIARRLGVGTERIRRVRQRLHLPSYRRGRRAMARTWEEAFTARTVAVDGGHLHWTGARSEHGTPVLHLRCETQTAARFSFRQTHGREAIGHVTAWCDYPHCVAGDHLEDQAMREARRRGESRQ